MIEKIVYKVQNEKPEKSDDPETHELKLLFKNHGNLNDLLNSSDKTTVLNDMKKLIFKSQKGTDEMETPPDKVFDQNELKFFKQLAGDYFNSSIT